ncbi:hypothetical protein [Vibrio ponticus]|uniref:hypothetical protein n=1 Tax=Vibrio ponticus TaxID=265668 RepID=UPI00138750CC|nr:hypothetical protein [Vibrio ponticus]
MNSLLKALIEKGYKAKVERERISIRFSWATMPVFIVRNETHNIYQLKQQYWNYIFCALIFSINIVVSVRFNDFVTATFCGAIPLFYLLSALYIYYKTKDLQIYIKSINGMTSI